MNELPTWLSKVFAVRKGDTTTLHYFSPAQSLTGIAEKSLIAFEASGWICVGRHVRNHLGEVVQSGWDGFASLAKKLSADQSETWNGFSVSRFCRNVDQAGVRHDGSHEAPGRPPANPDRYRRAGHQ